MPTLATTVNGLTLPNPFIIGSGPPGTNANVIGKAFDEGWGAVIAKTISLDSSKVVNVAPRYARMRVPGVPSNDVWGWENIELISDRPFDVWIKEFKQLKDKYPDRILIASIMEEYNKDAWVEIVERCDATGIDGFELNFSCPHGLPERKMGSAMGQDPAILEEVCGWVMSAATKPVWAKMTPNITHIEEAGAAALAGGCDGLSAINTILCVMGVNLETLRPEPTVEGYTTPGGYSCKAVRPIALRMVMELAQMIEKKFKSAAAISPSLSGRRPGGGSSARQTVSPSLEGRGSGGGSSERISRGAPSRNKLSADTSTPKPSPSRTSHASPIPLPPPSREGEKAPSISGIGGIETGDEAAQFILLGADTIQVCTGVMIHGYKLIHELKAGLLTFMEKHGFNSIDDFRGKSLPYFTTHFDLVQRQAAAKKAERAVAAGAVAKDGFVKKDADWSGDKFVEQSDKLLANK